MEPHSDNLVNYGKLCRERTQKYMVKSRQVQVEWFDGCTSLLWDLLKYCGLPLYWYLVGTWQWPRHEHETNAWHGWFNTFWFKGNFILHFNSLEIIHFAVVLNEGDQYFYVTYMVDAWETVCIVEFKLPFDLPSHCQSQSCHQSIHLGLSNINYSFSWPAHFLLVRRRRSKHQPNHLMSKELVGIARKWKILYSSFLKGSLIGH